MTELRQCLSGTADAGIFRSLGVASCRVSSVKGATGALDAFMGRHSHPGREEMKAGLVDRLFRITFQNQHDG
jgi:hypothetical protein